jgi:hypothetical protein
MIVAYPVHTRGWAAEGNARRRVDGDGEIVRSRGRKKIVNPSSAADFTSVAGEKSGRRIAKVKEALWAHMR